MGLCMVFRQMEMLKSSAPRASIEDAVALLGGSCLAKNRRGLNAWSMSTRRFAKNEAAYCNLYRIRMPDK